MKINLQALFTSQKQAINQIYNVACGEATTLNQLYDYLRTALGVDYPAVLEIEPIYKEVRSGDIPHSLASIDKAKSLLSYDPKINIQEGITRTVAWYSKNTL